MESTCHTPSLSAPEVKALIDEGADLAVLDVRRFEEFRTMSIPTGLNVPNAELTLRVFDLVPSPDTLVIVNCVGRTRSIIGTQTLINAGLPNRVAALRNGTIGWTLEGYGLESGRTSTFASEVRTSEARAKAAANRWAARVGVRSISRATLNTWIAEATSRTVYLLDVRTPAEHAAGHPSGFRSAPGGQLVQATDEWIAVRGARIVLFDDAGVRAQMTASWLVQMGWEAVVLEPDAVAANETGLPSPNRPPWPQESIDACAPAQLVLLNAEIVDLASSAEYAKGHIPRASFVLRSRFAEDLPRLDKDGPARRPLVLTSPDGVLARYAAAEAAAASGRPVYVLTGGTNAWVAAGFPVEQDACDWVSPAIDRYRRPYEGTDNSRDAMQAYIDWELQLVAQLAVDGVSRFRVVTPV